MQRTISVRLLAEISGYINPLKQATQATKDFRAELAQAASAGKLDAVASAATRAGLALSGGFLLAVGSAAKFEKQMSSVEAATQASVGELEQLRQAALKAGQDTAFSATEAAAGIEELAKAGVSTADVLSGGLAGALDLAAAGEIGVADAAETAASAMTQFELKGSDVTHIADLLAAAAGKAQGGVGDMAMALKQSGLVAAQTGLSIEETTGTLAAFASAGLIGSDAGTSFKTMLLQLAAPTDKARDLMDELGISAFDASGEFVGMSKLAGSLEKALAGMSAEQRQTTLATIFGTDAIRAASIVYSQGERGIADWTRAVDDQGFAADTAATKTDNLIGDLERLKGSVETLLIESGSGASGGLRSLVQGVEGVVNAFASLPGPVQQALVVLAGVGGGGLLATSALIKVRDSAHQTLQALADMGPVGARASGALSRAARVAGVAAGAFAALSAAGLIVGTIIEDEVNPQAEALALAMDKWADSGQAAGEAARVFGDDADKLARGLSSVAGSGFSQTMDDITAAIPGFNTTVLEARDRVRVFDEQLAALVKDGNAEGARRLLEDMARQAGLSTEEVMAALPAYRGALDVAAEGTSQLASDTAHLAREQLTAVDAGEELVDLWDRMHGAAKTADEEMLDAVRAVEDITDAFQESSGALEGNSRAALENRLALQDAAREAYEAADAYLRNGGNAAGAQAILDDFRASSDAAAIAAGGNAEQVKALNDELYRLPPKVSTTVAINYKLSSSGQGISGLGAFSAFRWGGVTEHAQSGLLREAAVFGPRSPARYAFAEPATQGEAFIPKRGDYGQSMAILQHAAGWYGATVTPGGGGMQGPSGDVTVTVLLDGQAIEPRMVKVVEENNYQLRRRVSSR